MPVPRGDIVTPEEPTWYHCYSRCVRRAFLCGEDSHTGRSFEHRRAWISVRVKFLLGVFAFDQASYAVLSNHVHTLLHSRPDVARAWSPEEVAQRWVCLFPKTRMPEALHVASIMRDPERIELYRERLSSISWFHRCLNEHIARRANHEDECTGRFWEGRFRSERLEGEAAVLACSVYVDLNPIRAGMCETPEESMFTGVHDRILSLTTGEPLEPHLLPTRSFSKLSEEEYVALVDETGRSIKDGKSSIPARLQPILERLGLRPEGWLAMCTEKRTLFRRIIGPVEALRTFAEAKGRRWVHGMKGAALVFA